MVETAEQYSKEFEMPGTITKLNVLKNFRQLVKMGGMELIFAVILAKKGTPFLTVYFAVENARHQRIKKEMEC